MSGRGSVYRRKDGRWVAEYRDEESGRRRYLYAKSRREAEAKLVLARPEIERDITPFERARRERQRYTWGPPLADFVQTWLETARETVSVRTWERYESIMRLHVLPELGGMQIGRISPFDIQALYARKLKSGLSHQSVRHIHATLRKALKQAVAWGVVQQCATDQVKAPRVPHKEMEALSVEQVKALLAAARGDRLEALYVLAVTTGARQGELLGLRWEDVDFAAGTITIARTIFRGRPQPPKTRYSRRTIKLSRLALDALARHRQKTSSESGYIFATRSGRPISCHNLINRSWIPLLKKAGIPHTRFHNLRHTAATLMLRQGVHPKIAQETLGHSSIEITLDLYSHVMSGMGDVAAAAMDSVLNEP